jgi:CHAT domain-containing protein
MDKYKLQQYTSTRNIALRNVAPEPRPASIALFGNAEFSMDSIEIVLQHRTGEKPNDIPVSVATRGNAAGTWPDLPGTADEVKRIADLFKKNRLATREFTGVSASEENLKMVGSTSSQTLHIATHGFFIKEKNAEDKDIPARGMNQYSLANDPLMRSGLILAGGNYAWGGNTPVDGAEDGIVTAYEISQLNLSNTELVVLSACETALGDIKGSEGVFGLQRAFKMAGVKKMIVSLWQVPDKETAELMTAFYTYWLKGKNIEDAFTQAQSEMRAKYAPYYWAAFVLIE